MWSCKHPQNVRVFCFFFWINHIRGRRVIWWSLATQLVWALLTDCPVTSTSASCLTRKEEMPSPTKSNPYHVNRHENHVLPFKTTAVCLSWRLTRHVLTCMWSSVVLSKRSDNKTKRSINFSITGKYVSTQMIWVWVLGPQHCKRLSE